MENSDTLGGLLGERDSENAIEAAEKFAANYPEELRVHIKVAFAMGVMHGTEAASKATEEILEDFIRGLTAKRDLKGEKNGIHT